MEDQVLNIQGVDVTLFRSHRAKSLNITIKPFTGVRVSVPHSLSFKKAKEATEQRINWIKSNLSKMQKAEDMFTVFNRDTKFQTRTHHLDIKVSDTDKIRSVVRNNTIAVTIPYSNKMEDAEVQIEIRKAIERAWRKEAKDYLPLS